MSENKKNDSKRHNSILNAFSSILFTGINGILTIIVTRVILVHYGSDYNGLNSTATQIVAILLVIESGFSLASNVALFSPLANNDINLASRIISTTKVSFQRIGLIYLLAGIAVVVIYSRFIVSSIPYYEILLILLISLFPTAINLFCATKYTVLFQSSQQEYIINIIKIISCVIGHATVIVMGSMAINRIILRILMLLNPMLSVIMIITIGKKKYNYLNLHIQPDFSLIPGTKDLMIQKFVGLIYSTMPTLIISATIGTVAISIYGVYYSVTALMKSIANAFINSPGMSLGVLISEKRTLKIKEVFREYEEIVAAIASIMTILYFSLIIPFVTIYTRGVTDANYIQEELSILLGIIFFVECLHIPSGIFLNMAGMFKVSRIIQTIAAVILGIGLVISYFVNTIEAFVLSVLIAAISLAIMEIGFVHTKEVVFGEKMNKKSLLDMLLLAILTIIISFIGHHFITQCNSYIELIMRAIIVFLIAIFSIGGFFVVYDKCFIKKCFIMMKTAIKIFSKTDPQSGSE